MTGKVTADVGCVCVAVTGRFVFWDVGATVAGRDIFKEKEWEKERDEHFYKIYYLL